jgi:hypothetical protein
MKANYTLVAGISAALFLVFASPVQAQPAAGMGMGPGSSGGGMGPGNGRAQGFSFDSNNTRGWSLMTPEEHAAHRDKMLSAKTYDECKTIQEEQHKTMIERAQQQGKTVPMPRQNGCDRMHAGGYFK